MNKRLATLVLAFVMVLGVFCMSGCGNGKNPDDGYNYYASRYGIEGDIKIEPVNYFGVEKMCTTAGTFLIYIDNEDAGAKDRLSKINSLANEWGVVVHHFNPDLGGGYAKSDVMAKNIDLTTDLDTPAKDGGDNSVVANSSFAAMQAELCVLLKTKTDKVPNHTLFAVAGKEAIAVDNQNYAVVGVNEAVLYNATKAGNDTGINHSKPELYKIESGYGTAGDDWVGHIFDLTKDVNGKKLAQKGTIEGKSWKEVYNTYYDITEDGYERNRARYGGAVVGGNPYENNEGYIYHVMDYKYQHSVKKSVCLDQQNADPADAIRAVAWKKPSYAKYVDENGKITSAGYLTQNINTFNMYGDYRLHMAGDFDKQESDYTGEKTDVYHLVANYAQFEWLLNNNDGSFAVYFGGPWCPNSQAVMKITNDIAKDYGIEKIYVFDPRLDGGVRVAGYGMTGKRVFDEDGNQKVNDSGEPIFDFNVLKLGGRPYEHMLSRNADFIQSDVNSGKQTKLGSEMYGANFLYANFLENYLTDYVSYWKLSKINIDRNANGTYEQNESFTEMSVPNLMAFDGSGDGKAQLKAWAEAEYHWAFTSIEGNAKREAWIAEIKQIFDLNPYVQYLPSAITGNPDDDNQAGEGGNGQSPTKPNGEIESC